MAAGKGGVIEQHKGNERYIQGDDAGIHMLQGGISDG
jgi:hypothetical protein